MTKVSALPLEKLGNKCGGKNHFRTVCKSKESESRHDSRKRPNGARKNRCSHRCDVHMKSMKMSVMRTAQWRTWMSKSNLSFTHRSFEKWWPDESLKLAGNVIIETFGYADPSNWLTHSFCCWILLLKCLMGRIKPISCDIWIVSWVEIDPLLSVFEMSHG